MSYTIIKKILFSCVAISLLTSASFSYAEEAKNATVITPSPTATPTLVNPSTQISEYSDTDKNSDIRGNFFVRFWNVNDSIDSYVGGELKTPISMSTQQGMGVFEIGSDYWFGLIGQEQLYRLGSFFGIGFSLAAGKLYLVEKDDGKEVSRTDQSCYWLNLDFLKIPILKDAEMKNYLSLTGNYISYSNNAMPTLGAAYVNPFSGLGVGLEGKCNILDTGSIVGKCTYIPFAGAYPFSSAYGINSEIGLKWFVTPKAALNIGYKLNYYGAFREFQATLKDTTAATSTTTPATPATAAPTPLNLNVDMRDLAQGLVIGGTYYF